MMKRALLLAVFALNVTTLFGRNYEDIDTDVSVIVIEKISSETVSIEEKHVLVEEIAAHPGSYAPTVLYYAGLFLLQQKDLERAANYCIWGCSRTELDARMSLDPNVTTVGFWLRYYIPTMHLTPEEDQCFAEAKYRAADTYQEWERNTPRDYDEDWIRLVGLDYHDEESFKETNPEEKVAIMERFFREIDGTYNTADYALASTKGEWAFDLETRRFSLKNTSVSMILPESMKPLINQDGKLIGRVQVTDLCEIYLGVDRQWSDSLEEDYQSALKYQDEDYEVKRAMIGSGIPAFTKRYKEDDELVVNRVLFFADDLEFDFAITCLLKEEQAAMIEFNELINSIELQ